MKRGEECPFPAADTTNDTAWSRDGRRRVVETMGRAEPYRNRRAPGSMIRHAIVDRRLPGRRLAQSISALTISMIESAFKAELMPAAGLALLCGTSSEATGMAAIAMSPVTMGTDEEHGAAIGRRAELLVEDEVVVRRHPGLGEGCWTSGARRWQHSLAFEECCLNLGATKVKPRLLAQPGFICSVSRRTLPELGDSGKPQPG